MINPTEPTNWSVSQSVNQSISQSVSQSISRSVNEQCWEAVWSRALLVASLSISGWYHHSSAHGRFVSVLTLTLILVVATIFPTFPFFVGILCPFRWHCWELLDQEQPMHPS